MVLQSSWLLCKCMLNRCLSLRGVFCWPSPAPLFQSLSRWLQPPLLRADRLSVGLSSTPSSSLLLPKHFRFPPGAERSPLPHCPVSVQHTHTASSHVSPGWLESCCAATPQPTLYQRHQAVLKPTRSSLINITPVPLRTAAPSILRCTPALCDVITRLHAVSALRVSSSVFSFYSFFFPPTMDLSRPFLQLGFIPESHLAAPLPWPETLNRSEQ